MDSLKNCSTQQLVKELTKRKGVINFNIENDEKYIIANEDGLLLDDYGSVSIIVIIDKS